MTKCWPAYLAENLFFLALGFAGKSFAVAPPRDSLTFQGKPVRYWRELLATERWTVEFYYPTKTHPLYAADPAALPMLMQLAVDSDDNVRAKAIRFIRRLRGRASVAVPVLTKALSDTQEHVKIEALLAIKAIGPKASNAKPAVEKLLSESCGEIAELAADTLEAIQAK